MCGYVAPQVFDFGSIFWDTWPLMCCGQKEFDPFARWRFFFVCCWCLRVQRVVL